MFRNLMTASAALLGLGVVTMDAAHALPTSIIQNGRVVLEDDSGEFILRLNKDSQKYEAVTGGDLQTGDLFVGVLEIDSIPTATGNPLANTELTGIFITELTGITPTGTESATGSGSPPVTYDAADFTFSAVDPSVFASVFGIAAPAAGTVAMLFEDPGMDLDLFDADNNPDNDIFFAKNGDLFLTAALDPANNDFFSASDVPTNLDVFGNPNLTGGVSQLGNYQFDLTITEYNGPGTLVNGNIVGTGNILAPVPNLDFATQDDIQISYNAIPEPSTLGLLGLGLLGMGLLARRRTAAPSLTA